MTTWRLILIIVIAVAGFVLYDRSCIQSWDGLAPATLQVLETGKPVPSEWIRYKRCHTREAGELELRELAERGDEYVNMWVTTAENPVFS
jgi:hypothetical protein